jgi:hypothetical protein
LAAAATKELVAVPLLSGFQSQKKTILKLSKLLQAAAGTADSHPAKICLLHLLYYSYIQ